MCVSPDLATADNTINNNMKDKDIEIQVLKLFPLTKKKKKNYKRVNIKPSVVSPFCCTLLNTSDHHQPLSCGRMGYSTVTDLAKFLGQSTSYPLSTARWKESSCRGMTLRMPCRQSTQ